MAVSAHVCISHIRGKGVDKEENERQPIDLDEEEEEASNKDKKLLSLEVANTYLILL